MSEDDQDKVFRGQGNICAPIVPAPVMAMFYVQQQWLETYQQTARTMLRMHPLAWMIMR